MTEQLAKNLKYLRLRKRWSQRQAGEALFLSPSTVGAYENGRSVPKLANLAKIAALYKRDLQEICYTDLAKKDLELPEDLDGKQIRILPITVDASKDQERVSLVPAKAAAGYLSGYADAEYIAELPLFSLPFTELSQDRTYRVFQIEGDSMLPIPSGSYIICEYVQNWRNINFGSSHIVVTREDGILFKRPMPTVFEQIISLHSDNKAYEPLEVELSHIHEFWSAKGYISFDLGEKLIK